MTIRLVEDPVPLHDKPPINDIPARLRHLADRIESGKLTADAVVVIVPDPGRLPDIYGFGEHLGDLAYIGLLQSAVLAYTLVALDDD